MRDTDDPYQRGAEDLPAVLREWVEQRPRWRVVQVRTNQADRWRWRFWLELVDLDAAKARHLRVTVPLYSYEPDDVRDAVLEALHEFGIHYGTGHA